jgi:hypothetical protein
MIRLLRPVNGVLGPIGIRLSNGLMIVLIIVPESRPAIGCADSIQGGAETAMD